MSSIPKTGLELRSLLTERGDMELSLVEAPVPVPSAGQVLIRVGGAPINPTDLAMLLGPADLSRAELTGEANQRVIRAPCLPEIASRYAGRKGASMNVGLEGAGIVVAAGAGAEGLLGRTIAAMGGKMYAQYALLQADQCLVMPEGVSPREAASSFVNPLTVLAMVETMRREGHTALVHTAAGSNLGAMLIRLCKAEGIPLVNIVRSPEQVAIVRERGGEFVCDSTAQNFREDLIGAVHATGATLAFDAIGGGQLAGQILHCMDKAMQPAGGAFNMYGGTQHKQLYIYGSLDMGPTEFSRSFGMAWGIGGWLLMPMLATFGPEVAARLRHRVATEIKTTFASHYTAELSLTEVLQPENLRAAYRRATGQKFLVNPSKT